MIIDFHTHYYPEKIVERALDSVALVPGMEPATDGTRRGLIKSMRACGIDYSLALPLANTPDNVRGVNRWAALQNTAPVFLLGSVHPRMKKPAETIKWIASLGLKGVKVHPEYQSFCFQDESFFPVWEACAENDLFVLTHAGGDINFEAPYKTNPRLMKAFHQRFDSLKLIIAHMGSWGMWDEAEEHLVGLPVYMDLAFTLGQLENDQLVRMIRRHGADRVLFGTDSPWRSQKAALDQFNKLDLDEHEKALILSGNAAQLLDLKI
ncbi:amidohydrolase family protein [Lentisphaerota bacterium ZTH]|nr:amidohydrolase family protein [Lentisphaerota bacterium]WET05126.1 amidohydrolase family protein [Lentisphaerota bacterium ZTH]